MKNIYNCEKMLSAENERIVKEIAKNHAKKDVLQNLISLYQSYKEQYENTEDAEEVPHLALCMQIVEEMTLSFFGKKEH